jgi:C-terminal processing protease CtpA/Prc
VIDVRGNGGGTREPLLELSGYLISPEDQPRIVNVAKYRLGADFQDDHLSNARFVYREDSGKFDDRELDAVRTFKRSFRPEWTPPALQFSEWHYLVLSKKPPDQRFHYPNPVVILMDEYCFSATDIFLSAFKGWPNVTLVGQASGGGSARTQRFRLANSRISVHCASMASFQADGRLYDTHGIEPDISVTRTPSYYIHGGPDLVLERAISLIRGDPDTSPDMNGE